MPAGRGQAINVAVSRARERFHLFHRLQPSDIKCSEADPRRRLIEYCERAAQEHGAARGGATGIRPARPARPAGFAGEVWDDLCAAGVEVRGCDEILQADWRDRMLMVEGKRMVAVVLCGGGQQTVDLWQVEMNMWTVLGRLGWRVVEVWRLQRALDPAGFRDALLRVLFEEEGVPRPAALERPDFHCDAPQPYGDKIEVYITAPTGARVMYSEVTPAGGRAPPAPLLHKSLSTYHAIRADR